MTDIVERLRDTAKFETWEDLTGLIAEAAHEIEALRDRAERTTANADAWEQAAHKAETEIERLRHPKIIVGSRELWEAMGLVVARSDALEEAARLADEWECLEASTAIRALKEQTS